MVLYNGRDGLSRQKRSDDVKVVCPFRILEDDSFSLLTRALENASFIRYFNSENTPEGYWKALYLKQSIVVLSEVRQIDTSPLEQEFVEGNWEYRSLLVENLLNKIDDWRKRLLSSATFENKILLAIDLENQITVNLSSAFYWLKDVLPEENVLAGLTFDWGRKDVDHSDIIITQNELLDLLFYKILESLRFLQENVNLYTKDIESSGLVDPSLALILSFARNYSGIASRFNKRWEELSGFYVEKILQIRPRAFIPDNTWLILTPNELSDRICIPAQTGFIAGKQTDDIPLIYRNEKESYISQIALHTVLAYRQDRLLLRKDLSSYINPDDPALLQPQNLFLDNDKQAIAVSMGMMIESPLFLLSEGERFITLSFTLTNESRELFDSTYGKTKYLNDAFCLEISTQEGWTPIPEYELIYLSDNGCLKLHLLLSEDFPATTVCTDAYGKVTNAPVLRLLMNPDAVFYPYTWATQCHVSRMNIRVDVTGISTLDIQNLAGPVSASSSFYPFGPMPERGAWMIWGNEEMAQKDLLSAELTCEWLELPVSDNGYSDIYSTYTPPLDNSSFKVQTAFSSHNKWVVQEDADLTELFSYNFPKGKVNKTSTFRWTIEKGTFSDGLFRLILAEPEIGFGYTTYRQMFSDIMIRNSHKKKGIVIPPPMPIVPLMDQVRASYVAEEEILFQPGSKGSSSTLYHIHPLMEDCLKQIDIDDEILLFEGISNSRNLLFAISGAVGETLIRLFIKIKSLKLSLSTVQQPEVRWLIKRNRWDWEKLSPLALLEDTTSAFMQTGQIELQLPDPVSEEWLDEDGLFWLCAAFKDPKPGTNLINPIISGFYTNAVQVTLDTEQEGFDVEKLPGSIPPGTITEPEKDIIGIDMIRQIERAKGGRPEETREEMIVRMANRINHRNRAVSARDYEEMALAHFPEIGKAYCCPGKSLHGGQPVVELTVVPNRYTPGTYPLCEGMLLKQVENYLQSKSSTFVKLNVDNPFYEEVTVRCWIVLAERVPIPLGVLEDQVIQQINNCIAPWQEATGLPVFNYAFTLDDMHNTIGDNPYIQSVVKLVVLQRTFIGMELYYLKDYYSGKTEGDEFIQPTIPGNILFPGKEHLIRTTDSDKWDNQAGIGELEISNTFIIR